MTKPVCEVESCEEPRTGNQQLCRRHYRREYHRKNRDRLLAHQREYYRKNAEHFRAKKLAYYHADREVAARRNRAYLLQRKYGISIEEYERLLEEQGGVCALCDRGCSAGRDLAVDHDHETGRIRALLCSKCNMAIGLLCDDPILAERVAGYLVEHGRLFAAGVGDDAPIYGKAAA